MQTRITRVELPCDTCGEAYLIPVEDSETPGASSGKISISVTFDALALQTAYARHTALYETVFAKDHPDGLMEEFTKSPWEFDDLGGPL